MSFEDLEKNLKGVKFAHLTEEELDAFCDRELDEIDMVRAEAHLGLCLICESQVEVLMAERAAMENREVTAEDVAFVRRALQKRGLQQRAADSKPAEDTTGPTLLDQLGEYLREAAMNWQAHFLAQQAHRGPTKIWRWQSDDGVLKARGVLEDNADLTIHFSSNRMDWDGKRIKVRLGSVDRRAILRRVSESEVHAKIEVPRRQRPKDMTKVSMEID